MILHHCQIKWLSCEVVKLSIYILQGTAAHIRSEEADYITKLLPQFIYKCNSEIIIKIATHLPKLSQNDCMFYFDSQCTIYTIMKQLFSTSLPNVMWVMSLLLACIQMQNICYKNITRHNQSISMISNKLDKCKTESVSTCTYNNTEYSVLQR